MLIGLTLYTASYIAEIVRGGIQAVAYGQHEAADALGLNGMQETRLILLPQALRVIIPPITSQYLTSPRTRRSPSRSVTPTSCRSRRRR